MTRLTIAIALVAIVGCSSEHNPVAPSPVAPPASVAPPPPVVTTPSLPAPPVLPPFPPADGRFDLAFYRQLAHNAFDGPTRSLARFSQAPRIYIRTVDDDGRPIDPLTLDQTAAALINAAGEMTGAFGLAGMEQGTGSRVGQPGWLTVRWVPQSGNPNRYCGAANVGQEGSTLKLYPYQANCGCGRFRMAPRVVKHELGHALGFWHTDSVNDLMWGKSWPVSQCEMGMSPREKYHAAVAYTRPIGSAAP